MISSSVTSRIRPGQLSAAGRSSRTMVLIGSFTSADTGTLTAIFSDETVGGEVVPVLQRGDDDPLGQRQHVGFAGAGQEHAGRQHAALRMPRAHQRLGAVEPHGPELDLRLVPELEPAARQHVGKRDLAVGRLGRDFLRPEHLAQAISASKLCDVSRCVRPHFAFVIADQ